MLMGGRKGDWLLFRGKNGIRSLDLAFLPDPEEYLCLEKGDRKGDGEGSDELRIANWRTKQNKRTRAPMIYQYEVDNY